jgi:serine/threonine protein phosphatase PrpC
MLGEDEIAEILKRESLSDAVVTLVEAANARGGTDNITVMIGAVPGGATTVIESSPRTPAVEWLGEARRRELRDRRIRRIAGATAAVAAALAAALVWLSRRSL